MKGDWMNLQINLFENKSIYNKMDFRYSSVIKRPIKMKDGFNLKEFISSCEQFIEDDYELVQNIKTGISDKRVVKDFWGSKLDNYFNLLACNTTQKFDSSIVVYSVQDLLPIFLSGLSKSKIQDLMAMENIEIYSRDLLEMSFTSDVNLVDFYGLSQELDSYLQNLFIVESNPQELLKLFINNINSYATKVLKYIAIYLETYSDLVFLSLDKSKIVFRSNLGTADVLDVRTSRFNFKLFPLIVKDEVEYFNNYKSFKYGVIECI